VLKKRSNSPTFHRGTKNSTDTLRISRLDVKCWNAKPNILLVLTYTSLFPDFWQK